LPTERVVVGSWLCGEKEGARTGAESKIDTVKEIEEDFIFCCRFDPFFLFQIGRWMGVKLAIGGSVELVSFKLLEFLIFNLIEMSAFEASV
jgi:hypothetical protein